MLYKVVLNFVSLDIILALSVAIHLKAAELYFPLVKPVSLYFVKINTVNAKTSSVSTVEFHLQTQGSSSTAYYPRLHNFRRRTVYGERNKPNPSLHITESTEDSKHEST